MPTAIALDFQEPTLSDGAWMAPILRRSGNKACEYSFTTIYMWRKYYENQVARLGDHLFLKAGKGTDSTYMMPVGGDLREGVSILLGHCREEGVPLRLFGAEDEDVRRLEDWFPGRFAFSLSEGDFDYIYNQTDLAALAGKKYHGKRNHIAGFSKTYAWSYEAIDDGNAPEAAAMATEWCQGKGNCADKGLKSENCAIHEALRHREALSLRGGLIRVDGKVVAFTLGSPINDEVFDIHVEKALPEYRGAYTVINKEFAARELGGYPLINRENDLGLEGLRKAKQSYYPALLLKKYVAEEKV